MLSDIKSHNDNESYYGEIKNSLNEIKTYREILRSNLNKKSEVNLQIKEDEYLKILNERDAAVAADPILNIYSTSKLSSDINLESLKKRFAERIITQKEYLALAAAIPEDAPISPAAKRELENLRKNEAVESKRLAYSFIKRDKELNEPAKVISNKTKNEVIVSILREFNLPFKYEIETPHNISKPYYKYTIHKNHLNKKSQEQTERTITLLVSNANDEGIIVFNNLPFTPCNIKDVKKLGGEIIKTDSEESINKALYNIIFSDEIEDERNALLEKKQLKEKQLNELQNDFTLDENNIDPEKFLEHLVRTCCYCKNPALYKDLLDKYEYAIEFEKIVPLDVDKETHVFEIVNENLTLTQATSIEDEDTKTILLEDYKSQLKKREQLLSEDKLTSSEIPLGFFPLYILQTVSDNDLSRKACEEICNLTLKRIDKSKISTIAKCGLLDTLLIVAEREGHLFSLKYINDHAIGFKENIKEFNEILASSAIAMLMAIRDNNRTLNMNHVEKLFAFITGNCLPEIKSVLGQSLNGNFKQTFSNFCRKTINPSFFIHKEEETEFFVLGSNIKKYWNSMVKKYLNENVRKS